MTGKSPVRSCEDVDDVALSYAEVKALATGNPLIKEKMEMDVAVAKLKMLEAAHNSQIYDLEDKINKEFPRKIAALKENIKNYEADVAAYESRKPNGEEKFAGMTVGGVHYDKKEAAGKALVAFCKTMDTPEGRDLGEYMNFPMRIYFNERDAVFYVVLHGKFKHEIQLGADVHGNVARLNNALSGMAAKLEANRTMLAEVETRLESARAQAAVPFGKADELKEKTARLTELNALLNMDEKESVVMDEPEQEQETSLQRAQKALEYER
jgi:hypothetical protein